MNATPATLPPRFDEWFARRGWMPHPHQLALLEAARHGRSHQTPGRYIIAVDDVFAAWSVERARSIISPTRTR